MPGTIVTRGLPPRQTRPAVQGCHGSST